MENFIAALGSLNPFILIPVIVIGLLLLLASRNKTKKLKEKLDGKDHDNSKKPTEENKYLAYVWSEGKITPKYINKVIGNEIPISPTFPISGMGYLCKETKGKLEALNLLDTPMEEGESPYDTYEAIDCHEVGDYYTDPASFWEKFQALVPYLIAGGEALVLLVLVDKFGGG